VIRWNIDRTYKGSPEASATANMFYSQDLACVLLEQGRVEEFLRMFYSILAANVSQETLTTCEWRSNTQPHVHSISSLVRMFRTMLIQERDGSPKARTKSDGNIVPLAKDGYVVLTHRYKTPGQYLVRVGRTDRYGQTAVGCVQVVVEEP